MAVRRTSGSRRINSVSKGKRAERDVARMLNEILIQVCRSFGKQPLLLKRNLVQAAEGGYDLVGFPGIAIEVKHHRETNGRIPSWWEQAVRQAGDDNLPILIYRANGTKFRVRLWVLATIDPVAKRRLKVCGDISWDDFLLWFERYASATVEKLKDTIPDTDDDRAGLFG